MKNPPVKVQIYALAKSFHCSPLDIQDMTLEDFNDYVSIMNTENVLDKANQLSDRRPG